MIWKTYCSKCGDPIYTSTIGTSMVCHKCYSLENTQNETEAIDGWRDDIEERLKLLEKAVYPPIENERISKE